MKQAAVVEPSNVIRTHLLGMGITISLTMVVVLAGLHWFENLQVFIFAGLGLLCGLAMLRWPDLTTLAVIGLIFSNLPVVAVKFHGAPSVLPAAVLAMLGWPLFYRIFVRKEKLLLLPASPFLILFTLIQLLGALLARDPQFAFNNFVSFILEGLGLYLLITNLVRTRRQALAAFWVLAACSLLMGGAPLLQQFSGNAESNFGGLAQADSQFQTDEVAVSGIVRQQRAAGTIGEQNRYAQCMILLVPIGFSLIANSKSTGLRLLAVAATFTSLMGFALAFSRGAAVGLVLAFAAAICLKLVDRKQIKLALIGSTLVLLLLPQYMTRLTSLGAILSVVGQNEEGLNQADGSIRGRLTEMGAAVLAFRDHPLIGVGPGMFSRYSHEYGQIIGLRSLGEGRQAHSLLLDIGAEHGIFGLFSIGGVLLTVIYVLLRGRRIALARSDYLGVHLSSGILLAVILYLSTGLFLHLSYIRYFWLLLALAESIGCIVVSGDRGNDYLPKANPALRISTLRTSIPAGPLPRSISNHSATTRIPPFILFPSQTDNQDD